MKTLRKQWQRGLQQGLALLSLVLLTLATATATQAQTNAQTATQQTVSNIHVYPNLGQFVFSASITSGSLPACAGDHVWAVNTALPGGKEVVSIVLAAKLRGVTVTVVGTGNCNTERFGYEVESIYLD